MDRITASRVVVTAPAVRTMAGDADLEQLVLRAAAGDDAAWQELWRIVEPQLDRIIAQPRFLGRLGQREDDRRNIVLDVMARLAADDRKRLRGYVETRAGNPDLRFLTWLRVVAKRVGIDYQRGHGNYIDRRRVADASSPGKWIEPGTLPPGSQLPGERPPVTDRGTAQQLLRYAAAELPDEQRRALELWVQSESYDAIAREIGAANATEAERKVRAAIERLRRKFRHEDDTSDD